MSKVTPEPDIFRGRRAGKYKVLTRLSVGGMAELFLAYTTGPGGFRKFVVLKQILPDIASDEAFVRMFLDEARITAALSHPNVGQVYELGEEEGQFYLAMEYIAGQNLENVIRRAAHKGVSLPVGFSVKVIRDVCLALNYAHSFADLRTRRSAGIVHRDISPKNIMVTYSGTVKVVDFGIAKARSRLIRTKMGMVKGTNGYMSPEQVRNAPVDGRTDLFASAVVLYELLTKQRLFSASTDLLTMKKVAEGEISPPQELNAALPSDLCAVVMKALERNVRGRFQNGREMARALEKACPDIADEDKTARLMSELFPDKMKQAQTLLESAGAEDSQGLYLAVRALKEDSGEIPKPSQSRRPSNPLSSKRVPSSPKLPNAEASSPSKKLHFIKKASSAEEVSKRSVSDIKNKTPASKPTKPSSVKSWFARLVWLGLLAAVVWAVGWGPLNAWAKPYASKLVHWVQENVFYRAPVVEVLPDDEPGSNLPDWVVKRRAEEERLAREKEIIDEHERRLSADPAFQKLTRDIEEQVRQMAQMEEEQNALKAAQQADRAMSSVHARKIEELEKKMAALSKQLEANRTKRASIAGKPVQVVDDVGKATSEGLGYFSLSTTNPTNAKVYFKNNYIGTTPLIDVLIEEGKQEFHLMDANGQRRRLSIPISRGQKLNVAMDIEKLPLVATPR